MKFTKFFMLFDMPGIAIKNLLIYSKLSKLGSSLIFLTKKSQITSFTAFKRSGVSLT